jgi:aspartate aminotransferase-like enzyme
MQAHKLFIPGPVDISEKTWQAFRKPIMGHRGKGFQELYARVQPGLQRLFYTRQPVFVATGSAWSVMEASLRNLVARRVLNCMNGAFSDKWYDVARKCGKEAEALQVEWGQPIRAEAVRAKLATGAFDAVTLIHNETSTGTLSPLAEIAALKKEFPGVMFIVDVVSSFTTVRIPFDELGIDVMLAGTQKALALPPGACVFTVSEAAQARAKTLADRGYYLDFNEYLANHLKNMTPTTPTISHFHALESKIGDIEAEGLENRYARHKASAELVRTWARERGFGLFPEAGFESLSLTCIKNTRNIDVAKLAAWIKSNKNCIIDGGYGKIKGATFRISHMGDESTDNMRELTGWLDEGLLATAD